MNKFLVLTSLILATAFSASVIAQEPAFRTQLSAPIYFSSQGDEDEQQAPLGLAPSYTMAAKILSNTPFEIPVEGGVEPIIWTVNSASLPQGMSFSDGVVEGTPTEHTGDNYYISVTATDSSAPPVTASTQVHITVEDTLVAAGHTAFTGVGTHTFTAPKYPFTVRLLLVSGAASGGVSGAPNGNIRYVASTTITGPTTVTVGRGGNHNGFSSNNCTVNSGEHSAFGSLSSSGGSPNGSLGNIQRATFTRGANGTGPYLPDNSSLHGKGGVLMNGATSPYGGIGYGKNSSGSWGPYGGHGGRGYGGGGGACAPSTHSERSAGAGGQGLVFVEWTDQ